MPLEILLPMVVFGIAGIAVLLHLLGLTGKRTFHTQDQARASWMSEFPQLPAKSIKISENHQYALIDTAKGLGLLWPMGADCTARLLTGAEVSMAKRHLIIRLPDYTAPIIRLNLTAKEAAQWVKQIKDHA